MDDVTRPQGMDSNQNNEKNPLLIVLTSFSPTMKQILSIQHLDFALIPSRPFSLPSELCIPHQPNCTQTRDSTYFLYRIKWMLNSDGWMMLHDLKGWMKVQYIKGWLKCLSRPVKFLFHDVIGSMKLHDLTGWFKTPHCTPQCALLSYFSSFFGHIELPLLFVSFLCPFSHDVLFNSILVP